MAPSLLFLTAVSLLPAMSLGFGTSTGTFENNGEHEKITKAALLCQGDVVNGNCFSSETMGQLAGHVGTFGAVGNPDNPIDWGTNLEGHEAHCDMADFFDSPDYPQSRSEANTVLLGCVSHIHERFQQGVDAAAGILDSDGFIIPDEVKIPITGCSWSDAVQSTNSKCTAILGFGRALHGIQDFYSHSNWADEADPDLDISVTNPPGLANTGLAPFLDSRFIGPPFIPHNLTTGCWESDDETPGVGSCAGRISHNSLNKDGGDIDPDTGVPSNPNDDKGPRAGINNNFARAVNAALSETRRQWRNFRDTIIEKHGEVKGARIICALTRDDPKEDCNGRKVAIVVDSSGSNSWTDPGNLRITAAQSINSALVTSDQATNPNSKPDLVTVVDFDLSATVIYPLGDPSGADFSSIDSDGGTYIAAGIAAAIDEITADTLYKTRGRSAIIVLTDGDDPSIADRLVQLARAYVNGIKVSFGFLAPVQVIPRRGLQTRQSSAPSEVLAAVLKTGGVYTTIDSAEAQQAFVDLVLSNGLTDSDDGSSSTGLIKGLGILGLLVDSKQSSFYEYDAKNGEEVTVDLEAKSSCQFSATLVDVHSGTVLAEATSFTGTESLKYTATGDVKLELEVTALASDGSAGSELECIFSVQLAGVYVPPTSSSSAIISSSATASASSSSASSIISSSVASSSAEPSSISESFSASSAISGTASVYPTATGTGKPSPYPSQYYPSKSGQAPYPESSVYVTSV